MLGENKVSKLNGRRIYAVYSPNMRVRDRSKCVRKDGVECCLSELTQECGNHWCDDQHLWVKERTYLELKLLGDA